MPFIPHTEDDINLMLKDLNLESLDELFKEIPQSLQIDADKLAKVPYAKSEMELFQMMKERSEKDKYSMNFIGAGSYEHYIPAAVWDIVSRGEYLTAYTPYQAEASQGTLQLIYEYQTIMSNLMAMEVSNASLYDGASALAEAILMAVRIKQKQKVNSILIPKTLNPLYKEVIQSITSTQKIELIEVPYCNKNGKVDLNTLSNFPKNKFAALVIPQPNFFGNLEDIDELTNWSHSNGGLVIGVVNPIAMSITTPPGEWGEQGADIVCGEGQPLGIPMSSGGPYFGFMCCKKQYMRQIPGRIVGKTTDKKGKTGFVLTLQAREQHIRRSKATSNICTNQGLLVTAATIHMSLLGAKGLADVAYTSHENKVYLEEKIKNIPNIQQIFIGNNFHEIVLKLDNNPELVLSKMSALGIQAGFNLERYYSELKNCILVCVTETKTKENIDQFISVLAESVRIKEAC